MPFFPADIENKSILPFDEEGGEDTKSSYRLPLSLDDRLVTNAPSTFFARLEGDGDNDLLIIDKSAVYEEGSLVVVYEDMGFRLRRLSYGKRSEIYLSEEDSEPRLMKSGTEIWGRVTYYIKSM